MYAWWWHCRWKVSLMRVCPRDPVMLLAWEQQCKKGQQCLSVHIPIEELWAEAFTTSYARRVVSSLGTPIAFTVQRCP